MTATDADMAVLQRAKYVVTEYAETVLTLDLNKDYEVASALTGNGSVVRKGSGRLTLTSAECAAAGGLAVESGTTVLPKDPSRICRLAVRGGWVEMAADYGDVAPRPLPPLEVVTPGRVRLPVSGNLTVRGLSGDGALVAHPEADTSKAQQLILVGTADGEAFAFSGNVPANLAFTLNGGNQQLLRPVSESRKDFRMQSGLLGVASFGVGADAGSFGTSDVWMQGLGDATLLYLGVTGETTERKFWFTSNPTGEITLDGGAHGGVTFAGRFACNGTAADFMMRLTLAGSNDVPCVIQGDFKEPSDAAVHVTKRGTGRWRFPAKDAGYKGVFAVESGTLECESLAEAGTPCSLGTATILHEPYSGPRTDARAVPYAYLLGNGETAVSPSLATLSYVGAGDACVQTRPLAIRGGGRLRNASSAGGCLTLCGVTARETGINSLCLDGDGTVSRLYDVTNGVGTIAIIKEGTGTWELDGHLEVEGGVTVRAGVLKMNFSPAFSWFRFSAKELYSAEETTAVLGHLALFDASRTDVARGILYNAAANGNVFAALAPGQVAFEGADVADDTVVSLYPPSNLFVSYVDNTTARWPKGETLVFRLPSEATVCGYDLISGWREDTVTQPFKWTVTDWTLEGSADGRHWTALDAKSDYRTCRAGKNYWLSDASAYEDVSRGFEVRSADETLVKGRSIGMVAVATGATLDVRGEPTATGLGVGEGWAGTLRGVAFAATGTLALDVPETAARAFTVPCTFEGCAGLANLSNWTLTVGGRPSRAWTLVRADETGLSFTKRGLVFIVK